MFCFVLSQLYTKTGQCYLSNTRTSIGYGPQSLCVTHTHLSPKRNRVPTLGVSWCSVLVCLYGMNFLLLKFWCPFCKRILTHLWVNNYVPLNYTNALQLVVYNSVLFRQQWRYMKNGKFVPKIWKRFCTFSSKSVKFGKRKYFGSQNFLTEKSLVTICHQRSLCFVTFRLTKSLGHTLKFWSLLPRRYLL